ncbi:class A beta-lactamase [Elstera cyanobacteriorum]|uniref:Beta-lactamase n=2 Tax=Elstera cyanobacteriorum TaxID=2022747 RepID=A0A255XSG8_9PROT|nr:class A beta-lactamase [Elstera cyanobacteriorum]
MPGLAKNAPDTLTQTIIDLETRLQGRFGVLIHDTETGKRWQHRADERFPMCSTFKYVLAAAILARVEAGEDKLDRRLPITAADLVPYAPVTQPQVGKTLTLAELCHAAVTVSDNTAANLLLRVLGGPAALTGFLRRIGDNVTRLDRWEPELNSALPGDPRDTTTPAAMTRTLENLLLGPALTPASKTQLTLWLIANTTGDAKVRAGLPKSWRVGDKTGSGARGTMNDVVAIWPPQRKPVLLSLYLTETKASMEDRNAAFAAVGTAIAGMLGG